jgi:prepilin-type N-terminal cleavage/methylation domain-containing protein
MEETMIRVRARLRRSAGIRGVTLIELVITMVLISIASFALFGAMAAAQRMSFETAQETIAGKIADSYLALTHAEGYSEVTRTREGDHWWWEEVTFRDDRGDDYVVVYLIERQWRERLPEDIQDALTDGTLARDDEQVIGKTFCEVTIRVTWPAPPYDLTATHPEQDDDDDRTIIGFGPRPEYPPPTTWEPVGEVLRSTVKSHGGG